MPPPPGSDVYDRGRARIGSIHHGLGLVVVVVVVVVVDFALPKCHCLHHLSAALVPVSASALVSRIAYGVVRPISAARSRTIMNHGLSNFGTSLSPAGNSPLNKYESSCVKASNMQILKPLLILT